LRRYTLALNVPQLTRRIIVLKTELPTLNVQELIARRPRLLTEDEVGRCTLTRG
jgi:hypothetical protein